VRDEVGLMADVLYSYDAVEASEGRLLYEDEEDWTFDDDDVVEDDAGMGGRIGALCIAVVLSA
jgi:hypothetical protein